MCENLQKIPRRQFLSHDCQNWPECSPQHPDWSEFFSSRCRSNFFFYEFRQIRKISRDQSFVQRTGQTLYTICVKLIWRTEIGCEFRIREFASIPSIRNDAMNFGKLPYFRMLNIALFIEYDVMNIIIRSRRPHR